LVKKLPNCKDISEGLKAFDITYGYETVRKNAKIETVEVKGKNECSAGANFLLWLIVNDINKNHIKKKAVKLIEINEKSIQSNPL
jgi:hypothetical protein